MLSSNDIFQTSRNGELVNQVEGGTFCLSTLPPLLSQAEVEETALNNSIEDSCDTFFEADTEDISMPAESQNIQGDAEMYPTSFMMALKKVVNNNTLPNKVENAALVDPYHIPTSRYNMSPTPELITPQKELKNLIKEVELNPAETTDNHIDKLTVEKPYLEVIEQPETTYRARYESEGCKGPIHGASENEFPAIRVVGYVGKVVLTVYVVTRDNEPHLHSATGPGSSKVPCKTVLLDDNTTQALQMTMIPADENDEMVAVFDQLSIRRVRNWEADRELRKRGIDPTSWKSKKKEAKLAFHAEIFPGKYHPGFTMTEYSRSFLCTAPSGNPEIWWASTGESPPEGGGEIGFIGKKFASGFKVRFYSKDDDGNSWEVFADIDRAKSNLNACVVRIPPYKDCNITESVIVHVEIRVGSEKEPRCSDAYPFTYKPNKPSDGCENCTQIKELLHRIYAGDNTNASSLFLRSPETITTTSESIVKSHSLPKSTSANTNNHSQTSQNITVNSSVNLKDLLQLYKLKAPLNVSHVNNKEMKTTEPAFVFIPKTTAPSVQQLNVFPTGFNHPTVTNNQNQNIARTVNSTQPSFVTIKVTDSLVLNQFENTASNTMPNPSLSKTLLTTQLTPAPAVALQESQMEVTPSVDNISKTPGNFVTLPNTTLQFSNSSTMPVNMVPCSIVQTNSTDYGQTLHLNQIPQNKVKEEQASPVYHTIAVRNPLPVTNSASSNQLVYSAVALSPQVSNHMQQGFTIQQVPQNTAVAFVPAIATQNNQVVVTPLEKEIQMLTNRVQSLKKELESKRSATYEYNVIQQGTGFVPSHQVSNNENMVHHSTPSNVLSQFKGNVPIIQSCTSLLQNTTPQLSQSKPEAEHMQTQTQVKLIPNQGLLPHLKLVNSTYPSVKFDQNGNSYAPSYISDVPGNYNLQNKGFQQDSSKVQNNIPTSQFEQTTNHDVLQNRVELRLQQPPQSSFTILQEGNVSQNNNAIINVNPSVTSPPVQAQSAHPQLFEEIQAAISIDNARSQNSFRDVAALIAIAEKAQPNQNETKNIDAWEQRLSVSEAIASNKVGYATKDCTSALSRPPSPMDIANDENTLLKTLQQLNNSSNNNNVLPTYKNNPNTVSIQASRRYSFDTTKEHSNQMQGETSFLDQNLSVDYSDNFKKAANNQNVTTSASWVYQGEVLSYGSQTVFVNEDSTSQGTYFVLR